MPAPLASVHIADVGLRHVPGVLRARPRPQDVDGLVYADTVIAGRLSPSLLPSPVPGRAGLVAFWRDDAALDAWLAQAPLAAQLADGFSVRMLAVRVSGAWPQLPDLVGDERAVEDAEPVAVLTYGRLRQRRVIPFLRASARAEADVLRAPGLVAGAALARPPKIVSTFSLWRSAAEMRAYAYRSGGHTAALAAVRANDFHHESMFARFRAYAATGTWDGAEIPQAMRAAAPAVAVR